MSRMFRALERAEASRRRVDPPGRSAVAPVMPLPPPGDEYEKLKVMLAVAGGPREHRALLLLSTLAGEGVSTVTDELASTLATGAREGVLVVDVAGPLDRPGLAEVLAKQVASREVIVPTTVPRLFSLGRGQAPLDFSRPRWLGFLEELLAELRSTFDAVLMDGGSLETAPNSLLLAPRVDGVALVVEAERTPIEAVRESCAQLRRTGANLLGVVLNRRRQWVPGLIARRL